VESALPLRKRVLGASAATRTSLKGEGRREEDPSSLETRVSKDMALKSSPKSFPKELLRKNSLVSEFGARPK
jgi:hypothetical protein